jgi:hypothetical protein
VAGSERPGTAMLEIGRQASQNAFLSEVRN